MSHGWPEGTPLHMGQSFWWRTSSSSHHCSSNNNKRINLMGVLFSLTDAGAQPQLLWALCVCFQTRSPCRTLHCWVCGEMHRAANNWKLTDWLGLNSSTSVMSKKPQIPECNQLQDRPHSINTPWTHCHFLLQAAPAPGLHFLNSSVSSTASLHPLCSAGKVHAQP